MSLLRRAFIKEEVRLGRVLCATRMGPPCSMNCRRSRRKCHSTHQDAVAGPFMSTSKAPSLRTYSQSVTCLRPMQWGSRITILLSLPLLTTSPMALVLPT
jgi:hypothetical protein